MAQSMHYPGSSSSYVGKQPGTHLPALDEMVGKATCPDFMTRVIRAQKQFIRVTIIII